jgi:hypothetical protein
MCAAWLSLTIFIYFITAMTLNENKCCEFVTWIDMGQVAVQNKLCKLSFFVKAGNFTSSSG